MVLDSVGQNFRYLSLLDFEGNGEQGFLPDHKHEGNAAEEEHEEHHANQNGKVTWIVLYIVENRRLEF